jgi:hypothetical protein
MLNDPSVYVSIVDVTQHPNFSPVWNVDVSKVLNKWFILLDYGNGNVVSHNKNGYSTVAEAEHDYQKIVGSARNCNNEVFVVMKNADFTGGMGSYVLHKMFKRATSAFEYIMSQSGIFGSPQYYRFSFGVNVYNVCYFTNDFNGFEIRKMEVE